MNCTTELLSTLFLSALASPTRTLWGGVKLVALLGLGSLIFLLRSRSLIQGDGFSAISDSIGQGDSLFPSIHHYLKPFSIVLHRLTYATLNGLFGWSAESSFAVCSTIGGVVGLTGLASMAKALTSTTSRYASVFLCGMTAGGVMLFFGHMELYVWGAAAFVWFLAFALKPAAKGATKQMTMAGSLAALFNLMLVPAILAVVVVKWSTRRRSENKSCFGLTPLKTIVVACLSSFILALTLQFSGIDYGTVSVWPRPENPYWVLSRFHLSDTFNLLVFSAPLGLLLTIVSWRKIRQVSEGAVLLVASAVLFTTSFWIDADIGAVRDWDLLSLFGLPLSLLGATAYLSGRQETQVWKFAIQTFALTLFLLFPMLYEQTHPDIALARINQVVWDDPHYQVDYKDGVRCIAWSVQLNDKLKQPELAIAYLRRRVAADSTSGIALANLGEVYAQLNKFDTAAIYFRSAYSQSPLNSSYRWRLAQALMVQGRWSEAATLVGPTAQGDSVEIALQRKCGSELFRLNQMAEALVCFRRSDSLSSGYWQDKVRVAMTYGALQQLDSAKAYGAQAEANCQDTLKCEMYRVMIIGLYGRGHFSLIEEIMPRFRLQCAGSNELAEVESKIQQ